MEPKLLIATPCYGGMVTSEYLQSMLVLSKTPLVFDLMIVNSESLVSRARNSCVARFLDRPSYTHLLFIDADIGFQPDQVGRLLHKEAPVVAGVYPKKSRNWAKAARLSSETAEDLRADTLDYVLNVLEEGEPFEGEHFDGVVTDGYLRVAYAGTGFMLIERSVFDVMRERYPDASYVNDSGGYETAAKGSHFWAFFEGMVHPRSRRYLSEDFGFCYRWRACGGEIWVDATSRLTHVGRETFEGDAGRLRKP